MAISKEDVLEYISGLSVLELSELVKEFEENSVYLHNRLQLQVEQLLVVKLLQQKKKLNLTL